MIMTKTATAAQEIAVRGRQHQQMLPMLPQLSLRVGRAGAVAALAALDEQVDELGHVADHVGVTGLLAGLQTGNDAGIADLNVSYWRLVPALPHTPR